MRGIKMLWIKCLFWFGALVVFLGFSLIVREKGKTR
jgi:hypothetical protein